MHIQNEQDDAKMTYVLGFRQISNRCLLIILLFALGSLERTDALCGKPGLTLACRPDVAKEVYEVAEKVTYKCTDCHTFDKIERHCHQNGSWSGHIPVCHKLISMKNVKRLRFVNSTRAANSTMDKNTQTCSDQITPDPIWEVVLTESFQISVVKVAVPAHAAVDIIVKIGDGNNVVKSCGKYNGITESARRTIVFLCEKGIRGDRVRIIQPNAAVALCEVYLHSLPPDEENCFRPDSPFLANGRKSISQDNITYIFNCNSSYELVGNPEVNCKGGTWSKSSAFCRKKEMIPQGPHCHSLPNVKNGFLIVTTTSINGTAYLECHEGYIPQGADRVYCLTSGKWTSNVLTCKVIECETNPTIRHGKGVMISKSAIWGAKLQIICNPGFIAIDPELRTCHKNATWGNLDICAEISCGAFVSGTSDAEKWVSFNEKNSTRVLVCENGYYIEGSPAVTQCLPNGSWSYTNAVCRSAALLDNPVLKISFFSVAAVVLTIVVATIGCALCKKKRKVAEIELLSLHGKSQVPSFQRQEETHSEEDNGGNVYQEIGSKMQSFSRPVYENIHDKGSSLYNIEFQSPLQKLQNNLENKKLLKNEDLKQMDERKKIDCTSHIYEDFDNTKICSENTEFYANVTEEKVNNSKAVEDDEGNYPNVNPSSKTNEDNTRIYTNVNSCSGTDENIYMNI